MNPFLMLEDFDSGKNIIVNTDSIDVVTQLDGSTEISFKTMQPELYVRNSVSDIWYRIHGSPERKN